MNLTAFATTKRHGEFHFATLKSVCSNVRFGVTMIQHVHVLIGGDLILMEAQGHAMCTPLSKPTHAPTIGHTISGGMSCVPTTKDQTI